MSDEYDAAQERGEIRSNGERSFSDPEKVSGPEILPPKELHEARIIRNADVADPGIVAPSKAALRMRRLRDRKKRGKCVVPVEFDRGELADHLVELGLLAEWDSEDAEAIQSAIKRALKVLKRYA